MSRGRARRFAVVDGSLLHIRGVDLSTLDRRTWGPTASLWDAAARAHVNRARRSRHRPRGADRRRGRGVAARASCWGPERIGGITWGGTIPRRIDAQGRALKSPGALLVGV